MPTLAECLPYDALTGAYEWSARKLRTEVTATHDGCEDPWPGRHKHVVKWWELADGTAVGWNENTSIGWSFPVVRL